MLLPLLLLVLAGDVDAQKCTIEIHVIPPIAGSGQRCWFTAHHNCKDQPEWSVTPAEFIQPLEDCRKPITSSKDGRGPCAYIQAGAGEYTVFARSGDGRDARSVTISLDNCETPPDKAN